MSGAHVPPFKSLFEHWFEIARSSDEPTHELLALASFARGLESLIDLLEMDNSNRISASAYQPLFNYMQRYDAYFDEPCDKRLSNFRRWIQGYYLWSRLERRPDVVCPEATLRSQVSKWMDNDFSSRGHSSLTVTLLSSETGAQSSSSTRKCGNLETTTRPGVHRCIANCTFR